MNIEDIKKSVTNMTDDELLDLLQKIRSSRVSSKKATKASRERKPKQLPKQLETLLSTLSPEDVERLLAEVESDEG